MIIFTDIDDTLMQTSRKIKQKSTAIPGAIGNDGQHSSFMDKSRKNLLDKLLTQEVCIPVTARNQKSFDNLLIKFKHEAVLNFGATIINLDKSVDMKWANSISIKSDYLNQKEIFFQLKKELNSLLDDFIVKISFDHGIYNYMNFRNENFDIKKILNLEKNITDFLIKNDYTHSFYIYKTDRDLALIPSFIKKEHAVQYLLEQRYSNKELSIGIGDHKNDLSFMSCCDFIMVPTDSSLMKFIYSFKD